MSLLHFICTFYHSIDIDIKLHLNAVRLKPKWMYEVFKKLQSNIRSLFIQVHTRLQKLPKDPGQDTFVAMNAQHVICLQITLDPRDLCLGF